MSELADITTALGHIIHEDAIIDWLNNGNQAFGGEKPIDMISRGATNEIWRMILTW